MTTISTTGAETEALSWADRSLAEDSEEAEASEVASVAEVSEEEALAAEVPEANSNSKYNHNYTIQPCTTTLLETSSVSPASVSHTEKL